MRRSFHAVLFGGILFATVVEAQTVRSRADSVYLRAQTLVSEGNGAEGRALVDSMLSSTVPGSLPYADALFWRASLAATAAEAERDYRRIVIDHPLSPRMEDALLRLAQLELARGDRENALRHLQRLAAEFPTSAHRPRTGYWMARVLFESNDLTRACAANTEALQQVDARDIELKNQLEYQQQRCRGAIGCARHVGLDPSAGDALRARAHSGADRAIDPEARACSELDRSVFGAGCRIEHARGGAGDRHQADGARL